MTIVPSFSPPHIAVFTAKAWGHVRPMCSFIAKLVESKGVYVTMFTSTEFVDRVHKELSRYPVSGMKDFMNLVRVIGLGNSDPTDHYARSLYEPFYVAYDKLMQEAPIVCARYGTTHKAIPKPHSILLDFLHFVPIKHVRSKTGKDIKIYLWYPCSTAFLTLYSPDVRDDPRPRLNAEAERTGREFNDVAMEYFFTRRGEVIAIPGLPPLYDHEMAPQEVPVQFRSSGAWLGILEAIDICDGAVLLTAEELEYDATTTIKKWVGKGADSVYAVGPLLPPTEARSQVSLEEAEMSHNVEFFMDTILKSHGAESMLYISFGSLFWPINAETLWTTLDVVMEKKIPFIICLGAHFAEIPENIQEKIDNYKLGMVCRWAPQQSILEHKVTGWFLSHCGQNAVLETISAGVPMICWPFYADQPFNALNYTENFDVAYELFEVRAGIHGLKDIHRLGRPPSGTIEAVRKEVDGVLDDAFKDGGKRKRENMKKLQEKLSQSWKEDGSSKRDFGELVHALSS
ncbi:UDP-Glycosyltransferase/glycogen phosphorylase [Abortiporus biennis]|nr:UDP-Glycosyltransferase/glycogen phosphorylase [Abortiporus biennis]